MADIFGGAQVPEWLQRAARPIDSAKLGQTLGTGVAEMFTAMERDPSAPEDATWWDSRKGLKTATAEVRENQMDPLWKQNLQIKLGNYALDQKSKWLDMEATKTRIDLNNETLDAKRKTEQDEAEDSQLFNEAMTNIGGDTSKVLDTPMPAFKSSKYGLMWTRARESAAGSTAAIETKNRAIEERQQSLKDTNEFRDAMRPLGASARARIGAPKGKNGTYTDDQWGQLNEELAGAGLPLAGQKADRKTPLQLAQQNLDQLIADGAEDSAIEAAKAFRDKLTVSSLDLEKQRAKDKIDYNEVRQTDRKELMGLAQKNKIDLEKFKEDFKSGHGGKQVSEESFVDRHYTATLAQVIKNWDTDTMGERTTEKASAQTFLILKKAYKALSSQKGAQGTQAAPAPWTNAAPSGDNSKDPLGLFQ